MSHSIWSMKFPITTLKKEVRIRIGVPTDESFVRWKVATNGQRKLSIPPPVYSFSLPIEYKFQSSQRIDQIMSFSWKPSSAHQKRPQGQSLSTSQNACSWHLLLPWIPAIPNFPKTLLSVPFCILILPLWYSLSHSLKAESQFKAQVKGIFLEVTSLDLFLPESLS